VVALHYVYFRRGRAAGRRACGPRALAIVYNGGVMMASDIGAPPGNLTPAGNEANIPVAPEFFVHDLERSLRFYRDELGFRIVRQERDFAIVALADAYVLLAFPEDEPRLKRWLTSGPRGVGVNVRLMVDDVDAMYERASAAGCPIVRAIGDRDYGLRDFMIADPDGYVLRFASPVEK